MIGDYPTQLDEIDQWLNDNFGILPGACSSTENLRYSVARRVAEVLWPKIQSASSDVDEVAAAWCVKNWDFVTGNEKTDKIVRVIFKAGAEWQKAKMIRDCSVQASYEAEIEKAEERGYNLCKEQMLKEGLPKWKKSEYCHPSYGIVTGDDGWDYLVNRNYKIQIVALNLLPKED